MARTPTTADAFNAIADARRRGVLSAIGTGEVTVSDLVSRTQMSQPQVSKHLGVLRAVDLVRVRSQGRNRFYQVNRATLRPIHDWVDTFELTGVERLDRLDTTRTTQAFPLFTLTLES
ncbi:DNA-binding transcriptional ArsR family regulator [Mycobacteroides chelonae]|nr:DNA-binding transcriptional ArsR family regulator [Mycobacteroides chelonae]